LRSATPAPVEDAESEHTESRAETLAIIDAIDAVAHADTVEDAARAALVVVRRSFGWAYGSYWKLDPTDQALHFVLDDGDAGEEFRRVTHEATFREGVGLAGRAWKTRNLFFVRDLAELTDCVRAPAARRAGVKSGVCFPILVAGRVVGTMDFFALETLDRSATRFDTLRIVGKQVSQAIARLAREENLQHVLADTKALVDTISAVASATTADDAARAALDVVRASFGWVYGSYWKVDKSLNALVFAVESGDAGPEFTQVTRSASFAEGVGLAGRAWAKRDLFFTPDLGKLTDCVRAPVAQRAGVKSGLCIPILVKGEVVGTLDFFALETLQPSETRLIALRNVGKQLSQAFERILHVEAELRAAEVMRNLLETIAGHATALGGASEELTATAALMRSGADETSTQSAVVSAASTKVAEEIESVARSSEQLSSSISEIALNTANASNIGAVAAQEAAATNEIVSRLGESSTEIGQVVKLITTIAKQTNLLALNATIEAARAGAAGKGFAVVANEVKDLAKATAEATQDISSRIDNIQSDTTAAVQAISGIASTIAQVTELQTVVAAAVEEQTATTAEISRSVGGAALSVGEITANIEQVASAAATTASGANDSQHAANELATLAVQLQELVSRYSN